MLASMPQPAPVPRRRLVRAERARTRPMVFPALRQPPPAARRNRFVRPQLVQSRRGRKSDGLLHRRPRPRPSSSPRRNSNSSSSTTASCCSNIGCAATRPSRRSASGGGSTIRCDGGNCRPSISPPAPNMTIIPRRARRCSPRPIPTLAPWTLVDFNDQALGRLTLLRDLLDRLPDTACRCPTSPVRRSLGAPLKERFGVLAPIADYRHRRPRRREDSLTTTDPRSQ